MEKNKGERRNICFRKTEIAVWLFFLLITIFSRIMDNSIITNTSMPVAFCFLIYVILYSFVPIIIYDNSSITCGILRRNFKWDELSTIAFDPIFGNVKLVFNYRYIIDISSGMITKNGNNIQIANEIYQIVHKKKCNFTVTEEAKKVIHRINDKPA